MLTLEQMFIREALMLRAARESIRKAPEGDDAPDRPGQPAAPAEVPKPYRHPGRPIGRNEPCHCGSGKKYKTCHLPLVPGYGRQFKVQRAT